MEVPYNGYTDYHRAYLKAAGLSPKDKAVFDTQVAKFVPLYGANSPDKAGSSFIRKLRYFPLSHRIYANIGSKNYFYPMTPEILMQWLSNSSLGKWYNDHLKIKNKR